ncbi:MAG TPA: hypothetical protein DDY22_14780 [Geobacter sp.]|nr:hypothetical protein [Geobacter sp.]
MMGGGRGEGEAHAGYSPSPQPSPIKGEGVLVKSPPTPLFQRGRFCGCRLADELRTHSLTSRTPNPLCSK